MLARLLQFTTFWVLIFACAWLGILWGRSPVLAVAGFFSSLFLYVPFLGIQFLALRRINRGDAAPLASWAQLVRAWWGEVVEVPRIFCWRQAFFWNAIPDALDDAVHGSADETTMLPSRRGVVFIHGFICNRGLWTPWLAGLARNHRAFVAVNLEPVFGSIDDYVPLIEQAVQKVTLATGMPALVVCHSMGGLAVRAWLRSAAGTDARVHHVVTIGTPHHGTWLGRFGVTTNGRQMRIDSHWLQQLQAAEPPERYRLFTCFYSNCDNIVFPASTATLVGADNRLIAGAAHVALAFDQTVMSESLAKI